MKRTTILGLFLMGMAAWGTSAWCADTNALSQNVTDRPLPEPRVLGLSNVPVLHGRGAEVREALNQILDTDYCGESALAGVTQRAALQGEAPSEGGSFRKFAEEDWLPVLLDMANEEFGRLAKGGNLGSRRDTDRLWHMIALLGAAQDNVAPALDFIHKMAVQATPGWESGFFLFASAVWIDLTIEKEGAAKCLELSRLFDVSCGSYSWAWWIYFDTLGACDAFARCPTDQDLAILSRFVMEAADQCRSAELASQLDALAAGESHFHLAPTDSDPFALGAPMMGVPGWKGSLQRKRLAERFRDVPARGSVYKIYNLETGEKVLAEPTQRDIDRMIWARAAKELATDDAELTDLRKVYGDWTKEDARD